MNDIVGLLHQCAFQSAAKPGTSEALQEDLGNHVILVEVIIDETTVHSRHVGAKLCLLTFFFLSSLQSKLNPR